MYGAFACYIATNRSSRIADSVHHSSKDIPNNTRAMGIMLIKVVTMSLKELILSWETTKLPSQSQVVIPSFLSSWRAKNSVMKAKTGTPNPNPANQTEKLRLRALEYVTFCPAESRNVILRSHFPGVVPQVESREASAKTQRKTTTQTIRISGGSKRKSAGAKMVVRARIKKLPKTMST